MVFDVQRACTHDGPGIRTTVFLKGCPLHCAWCHNPESRADSPEVFFHETLCIACRACEAACPHGGGRALLDGARPENCRACAAGGNAPCTQACPTGAIEESGSPMTVGEVLEIAERDRVYFEESGGGITLSGGEPLHQPDFAAALLRAARERGFHTCMETSGAAPWESVAAAAPHTSLFLWDVKSLDPDAYRQWTGGALERSLSNLLRLDEAGHVTWLRCPIVLPVHEREPHLEGIAALYHQLTHCEGVSLLPYHPLGRGKARQLGWPDANPHPLAAPTASELRQWQATLETLGVPTTG